MDAALQRDYWPTTEWREAAPQDMALDASLLTQMNSYVSEHLPGMNGLLLVRHGYLVFEQYYQGFAQSSYNNISSATKSVVSMLVGIALGQGRLSLDQHMLEFFPALAVQEKDPRKHAITLRHLLSLQTGFVKLMPDKIWLDPVRLALERPMERQPGEEFFYDNLGVDILSAILSRVTGKSAAAFADETLFKTLGVWRDAAARFTWHNDPQGAHTWHEYGSWDEKEGYLWKVDPQGYSTGSYGAHFTAREMAKLGYLYLNQGRWDGEQVVPAPYVQDSTREQSEGGPPVGTAYGYLWWLAQHENHAAFFASGFGGKLIYVFPDLDLVVVTIASSERGKSNPHQSKDILALIPRFILPAVL